MSQQITYRYRALDAAGVERRESLNASSEAEATRLLIEMGLTPIQVLPVQTRSPRQTHKPVKPTDCVVLLREIATLLKAGISVNEALPSLEDAYREQSVGPALARLTRQVRAGRPLAQAMGDCGLPLPEYVRAMLDAGDASGKVAEACADAAAQMEHEQRIAAELRSALTYPVILVLSGVIAVLIIFIGVVPRFASILRNPRADVPLLSRWVIETGVFLQQHWLAFGLSLLGALLVAAALLGNQPTRAKLRDRFSRLPLLGPWLIETETGRWASLLGTLLGNRVPIVSALKLSASVLTLERLRAVLSLATHEIERGKMLSDVLAKEAWFPPTRLNLIRVGERSGELSRMLLTLGEMQTEASRQKQKRALTLVEPLAILLIGVVIGVIMVAVMMAITSLNAMAS
jgi:general secretion pathway protein F